MPCNYKRTTCTHASILWFRYFFDGVYFSFFKKIFLDLISSRAILRLPYLLREDAQYNSKKSLNSQSLEFALVFGNGKKLKVSVESFDVAIYHGFLYGTACVIATHVFNVTYSQYLYCTMQFI